MTQQNVSAETHLQTQEPLLNLIGVTKSFTDGRGQRTVLNNVDLQVHAGEFVSIMGPSGSGKSTLLRIAGGLDRADSGQILVAGKSLSHLNARELARVRRDSVGFIEQHLNLLAVLNPVENVSLPLELARKSRKKAAEEAEVALVQLGLGDMLHSDVDDLSGGERQRVAIARALIGDRQILLADEPTGSLDSLTGESVIRQLRQRCDEDGAVVVIATHNAAHAAWADRVLYLRDGNLVDQTGTAP